MQQLNEMASNPYVSPLMADFDIDDVSLFLVGLTYDACLDDTITLARNWKGHVSLDVLDDLPHGFLNFCEYQYTTH